MHFLFDPCCWSLMRNLPVFASQFLHQHHTLCPSTRAQPLSRHPHSSWDSEHVPPRYLVALSAFIMHHRAWTASSSWKPGSDLQTLTISLVSFLKSSGCKASLCFFRISKRRKTMKPRGRSPPALTQPILLPNASLSTLAYSELSDTLDRMFLCLLYLMRIIFHSCLFS